MHVRDTNNIYPVLRKRFWKQSLTCILEQGFLLLRNKMEIWKEIQGYSNYQVSNLGRVKSLKRNLKNGLSLKQETILRPRKTRLGYFLVAIFNPTRKDVSVHLLTEQIRMFAEVNGVTIFTPQEWFEGNCAET